LKVKIGDRGLEDRLNSIKSDIAEKEIAIANYNSEILNLSRHIATKRVEFNDVITLIANEKLKPARVDKFTEFVHYLNKYRFKIVGLATVGDGSKISIHTTRICDMAVENPDDRRQVFTMPILVSIRFILSKNAVEVYGDRSCNRRFFYSLACTYLHPHISSGDNGNFCLGNTATLLSNMLKNGVYNNTEDFIKVYADLLDSYNPASPYKTLQEVFLNNGALLFNLRSRHGQLSEDDLIASIDPTSSDARRAFLDNGKYIVDNYTSSISPALIAEALEEFLIHLKGSITKEAIDFIENSNVYLDNEIGNYYSDQELLGTSGISKYLTALRLFGGVE
jgi:hypothetical protein